MKKIENGCQDKLDWFDGKHINEILFCQEFLKTHPMRCIGGTLFTVDVCAISLLWKWVAYFSV